MKVIKNNFEKWNERNLLNKVARDCERDWGVEKKCKQIKFFTVHENSFTINCCKKKNKWIK